MIDDARADLAKRISMLEALIAGNHKSQSIAECPYLAPSVDLLEPVLTLLSRLQIHYFNEPEIIRQEPSFGYKKDASGKLVSITNYLDIVKDFP